MIQHQGQQFKLLLRYEKLRDFCNFCGIIGHLEKECVDRQNSTISDDHNIYFGNWLRDPTNTNPVLGNHSASNQSPPSSPTSPPSLSSSTPSHQFQ